MDFNDTPEEAEFRAAARAFLDAHARRRGPDDAPPNLMAEREDESAIREAQAWQATKFDNGWACLTWPKEYGGRGATPIQNVIWNQEESKYSLPPNVFGIGIGMAGPTIMTHGTEAQKERWLRKMARGDEIWCQLFSEPAAGSDLAGLRTTAKRDGDEWIVNGQKIWTTGAHYSKWGILVTRHDPDVPKHAGLTYFVVDMESPGIEARQIKQISGASGFNEVFFTDVRIPDEYRISEVGNGWRVAITTLMNERASIGGGGGGASFDDLLKLARSIPRGGRPAIEDSGVRQRLADIYVQLRGLQFTGYRTLTALSRGTTPGPENSIGKLVGAPLRQQMAAFAIDLEGAAGALVQEGTAPQDGSWQMAYLGSPGLRIAGGTDEILRNIIAERVLRLPPEIRVDKEIAFREVPTGPPGQ
ncbi:MAG: acyl-CoA dehydrogenase family protein [Myxococcota bacterium]